MRLLTVLLLASALAGACRTAPAPEPPLETLRLSRLASHGDPARRASLRLCTEGLRADDEQHVERARSSYERAISIDPTNPWAYLALARHEVEVGDPARALQYVQQAETLLRNEGALSPGVEPHVEGLRGVALIAMGRPGDEHLRRAAALAPEIWLDGRLDADELL